MSLRTVVLHLSSVRPKRDQEEREEEAGRERHAHRGAQGPRGDSQASDLGRRGGGTPARANVAVPLNKSAKNRGTRPAQEDVGGNVDAPKPDRGGRSASRQRALGLIRGPRRRSDGSTIGLRPRRARSLRNRGHHLGRRRLRLKSTRAASVASAPDDIPANNAASLANSRDNSFTASRRQTDGGGTQGNGQE